MDEDNFATPTQLVKIFLPSVGRQEILQVFRKMKMLLFSICISIHCLDEGQTASITFMQQPLPMFAANASLELVYVDVVNADVKVIAPVEVFE